MEGKLDVVFQKVQGLETVMNNVQPEIEALKGKASGMEKPSHSILV